MPACAAALPLIFGMDAMLIRILFIICAFAGFGLLVYIVLWIAVPSTASTVIGSAKKRLLRDPDDKLIGGVCRGLAYYFGVNVWVPRAIFLIPFFHGCVPVEQLGCVSLSLTFISVSFQPGGGSYLYYPLDCFTGGKIFQ